VSSYPTDARSLLSAFVPDQAFQKVDRFHKGLSRLLSADSTRRETPGRQIDGYERLEVIGVTRDSKFGEEGGLKPQAFGNPRFTSENVAISFTTTSFQTSSVKCREVPRSAKKPKKWRKTVARSSPSVEITC
jgi:hypothetical protein